MSFDIHRADQRGTTKIDWLYSRHSFSFGDYYDKYKTGFKSLLVLNDDLIDPNTGFGMHPHKNMEIITIVLKGSLKHKDILGNEGLLRENEVQVMTAGNGIVHAEYNNSNKIKLELLQIWISTNKLNLKPSYNHKEF